MNVVVRASIDEKTKRKASKALASMGLSVSDAIRLLLTRVAVDEVLPTGLREPNEESLEALAELDRGEGQTFATVEEFLADLNARD
jgi:DNA-damage-inducible protein J